MGHEYCGIVDEVGSAVKSVKTGTLAWRRMLKLGIHEMRIDLGQIVKASLS
jgi:hypothetical protein